jgi:hypothetical protein
MARRVCGASPERAWQAGRRSRAVCSPRRRGDMRPPDPALRRVALGPWMRHLVQSSPAEPSNSGSLGCSSLPPRDEPPVDSLSASFLSLFLHPVPGTRVFSFPLSAPCTAHSRLFFSFFCTMYRARACSGSLPASGSLFQRPQRLWGDPLEADGRACMPATCMSEQIFTQPVFLPDGAWWRSLRGLPRPPSSFACVSRPMGLR